MCRTLKITRITQPVLSCILSDSLGNDIVLDGRSLELMYAIQSELDVFEPIEDDECRLIWLEIPRGTAKEWKEAFGEEGMPSEEEEQDFLEEFPRETQWVFLTTGTYRGYTSLRISDRDHQYRVFGSESRSNGSVELDMVWFLEPLLALVRQRVADIAQDPEAYYRHIESCLPYRQRPGRIRSRDLNRILGKHLEVDNRDYCVGVMKELIRRREIYEHNESGWDKLGVPEPLEQMTIRTFCRFYRIADTVFHTGCKPTGDMQTGSGDADIEYYSHHGVGRLDDCNPDSPADFKKFALDHYGELGISRMNVSAKDFYPGGKWLVTFSFSYSAYLEKGLKIAVALYETGAPFIFFDAENVLHALEETGWVRLSPFTFHDYLQAGDDEGVFDLPYVEDCDKEDAITRQQYDEIVRLATWQPSVRLRLDRTVPLESPLYDTIRTKVNSPLTVSRIRQRVEQEYDICLCVVQNEYTGRYYYVAPYYKGDRIQIPETKFYDTFNAAMDALILVFNNAILHYE